MNNSFSKIQFFKATVDHYTHNYESSTIQQFFEVIEELNTVATEIASFGDINQYISHVLVPISSKWQKRTIRLVERIQSARNITGASLEYTQDLLERMNSTVYDQVLKTFMGIVELSEYLYESAEINDLSEDLNEISEEWRYSNAIWWIKYTMAVEAILLILLFIFTSIPFFRQKLLFPSNKLQSFK